MPEKYERRWAFIIGLAIFGITLIPYLLGYANQGSDWNFTGFIFGVEDGNSYIAKMLSGAYGTWLFKTPYTFIPQQGFFAFFPYLLLGKLSSAPGQHEQLVALFQIFRLFGVIACSMATHEFISIFILDKNLRRLATFAALLGGGLGFLSVFGVKWGGYEGLPLEFYSPETFGFLSLFGLPHLAAARALLLCGLIVFLRNSVSSSWLKNGLLLGVLWLFLGMMQPLTVVVGFTILGVGSGVEGFLVFILKKSSEYSTPDLWFQRLKTVLFAGLFALPIPVYTFIQFQIDPFLKGWGRQNQIMSPPPGDYLMAWLPVLALSLLGLFRVWQKKSNHVVFLTTWLAIIPFLAYFPYPLQRRLPEGAWVLISALAVIAMDGFQGKAKKIAGVIFWPGFFTTLLLFVGAFASVQNVESPLYVKRTDVAAFKFLAEQTPRKIVLAEYDVSNVLPAWAPVHTVIGHGPESVDLAIIEPDVDRFLSGELSEQEAVQILEKYHVDYVLSGSGVNLNTVYDNQYLIRVFSTPSLTVFQVQLPE